ncbi:hypothetical protein FisN_17Lh310 [Fistulifera solaris]|uniref:Uncharacterized protein n=1 Tax=Fistulifera solaris TaxID=1519565 RepID=A0A1Z5J5F7_FISSO|nr:hypothetical protein FisN_17Lh310 [Fistulifera solaris]|eukprot:GAX09227.1 hypothetical protein FisN_17Lh310 [Fistulifera solaris]
MATKPTARSGPDDKGTGSYVPPALDSRAVARESVAPTADFVMEPPKPKVGLTGKISTLFRQSKSHSENEMSQHFSSETSHSRTGNREREQSNHSVYSTDKEEQSDESYVSDDDEDEDDDHIESFRSQSTTADVTPVLRYRGFSTSIRSLFLDEPLVCASIGCFGLLLSNRTEYLLELRNERRGWGKANKKRQPSRLMAYALLVTMLLMFSTFLVFGFGTGNGIAGNYMSGYDFYNDKGNRSNGNNNAVSQDGGDEGEDVEEQWWDDYLQNNNNNRYYNNARDNDDDQRRLRSYKATQNRSTQERTAYPVNGIFKIRDCHETIWRPLLDFVRDEYAIYDKVQEESRRDWQQRRRTEDYGVDGDDAAYNDDANANNDDAGVNNDDTRDDTNDDAGQNYAKQPKPSALGEQETGSHARLGIFIFFLIFLGLLGRRRRMRTRFYVVRARAQEDHLYYASSDEATTRRVALDGALEDQYEGACSHTLFGCYPIDDTIDGSFNEHIEVADEGIVRRKKKAHHEDCVARGFNCLMSICCGALCKCWCQCLSICALAQEAREMRLLLPPRYQRIDFITHQPFHEYQKQVNDLRKGWKGYSKRLRGISPHFQALSKLSRYILVGFLLSSSALVAAIFFNPLAAFSWQDAVILGATFAQSFLIIFVVHWLFHKSDLSLDAVIKFFAAGFLVALPVAVLLEGLLVHLVLFGELVLYVTSDVFANWVDDHRRMIWILSEFFNAYVIAASVEELCKYYTFRAVEHPDLVFLTGLQRQEDDAGAIDGDLVKYPFASHQVQELIQSNDDKAKKVKATEDNLLRSTGTTETEFDEDENDIRTHRQRAMAITTAIISVAVGFACAESCLYVFVFGGPGQSHGKEEIMEEWIVLFFRSIFPIHALAAAMQSINMIRKFVEHDRDNGHRIGVGRIVFPALILHGTFDAILMCINVFIETAWSANADNEVNNVPYNKFVLNLVAWISISIVMVVGVIWYIYQNRQQRLRLIRLEEKERGNSRQGKRGAWKYPEGTNDAKVDYVYA